MKRSHFFLLLALTVLSVAYFYSPQEANLIVPARDSETLRAMTTDDSLTDRLPAQQRADEQPESLPAQTSLEKSMARFPKNTEEHFRQDLEKDPHQTPSIVIQSALQLGSIFDNVQSEEDAHKAFDFFAKCLEGEKVIAIQTSCFRYSERLSKKYPELQEQFSSLDRSAPEEVRRIVRFN